METVYRIDNKLMTNVISSETGAVGAAAAGDRPMTLEMGKSIMLRFDRLDQQMSQFQSQIEASFAKQRDRVDQNFRTIDNSIRRLGGSIEGSLLIQQANDGRRLKRAGEELPAEGNKDFMPTLSPNPRSLRELWLEYKFGIDGRKPAEHFTTREKNTSRRLKQSYYRRNVVWQCMARLVREGETVDMAIMKIRQCYGQQLSVTAIINKMIADRKNGGHPNLR
jgi:hypothetical protein